MCNLLMFKIQLQLSIAQCFEIRLFGSVTWTTIDDDYNSRILNIQTMQYVSKPINNTAKIAYNQEFKCF